MRPALKLVLKESLAKRVKSRAAGCAEEQADEEGGGVEMDVFKLCAQPILDDGEEDFGLKMLVNEHGAKAKDFFS